MPVDTEGKEDVVKTAKKRKAEEEDTFFSFSSSWIKEKAYKNSPNKIKSSWEVRRILVREKEAKVGTEGKKN